jgi:hypothetical protein
MKAARRAVCKRAPGAASPQLIAANFHPRNCLFPFSPVRRYICKRQMKTIAKTSLKKTALFLLPLPIQIREGIKHDWRSG